MFAFIPVGVRKSGEKAVVISKTNTSMVRELCPVIDRVDDSLSDCSNNVSLHNHKYI